MLEDNRNKGLYTIVYTLETLHNKGITMKETVTDSLGYLLQWYQMSGKKEYLEMGRLHMQAYVSMGFALDETEPCVKEMMEALGMEKKDLLSSVQAVGKSVKVSKMNIRSMIGKWKASKENPMSISEVVDDIMDKIQGHKEGRYVYEYHRKKAEVDSVEIYELIINKDECYFFDVKNFKFYTFQVE